MSGQKSSSDSDPRILTLKSGTSIGASIAYHSTPGFSPGIVFMTGFMSDMTGGKALALEQLATDRGKAFLRFDYQGHGASSGDFADGTIGIWSGDALAAFDELTEGPQIIVGSSMGGWMMLLTAIARSDRVAGMVGIAAAPDFTEDLLPKELTQKQLTEINEKGFVIVPSEYEDDYTITKALFDDGRNNLVLRQEIPLDCPVRLLHGMGDISVPWETALRIQEKLRSDDVKVILIKEGDHRLSEEHDLARLTRTVGQLLDQVS